MTMLRQILFLSLVLAVAPIPLGCGGVAILPAGDEPTDSGKTVTEIDASQTSTGPGEPTGTTDEDAGQTAEGIDAKAPGDPGLDGGEGDPTGADAGHEGPPGLVDGGFHHRDAGAGGPMGFDGGKGGFPGFDAG